jgi:hypothetical protein
MLNKECIPCCVTILVLTGKLVNPAFIALRSMSFLPTAISCEDVVKQSGILAEDADDALLVAAGRVQLDSQGSVQCKGKDFRANAWPARIQTEHTTERSPGLKL